MIEIPKCIFCEHCIEYDDVIKCKAYPDKVPIEIESSEINKKCSEDYSFKRKNK